jgi:hypothetical protein
MADTMGTITGNGIRRKSDIHMAEDIRDTKYNARCEPAHGTLEPRNLLLGQLADIKQSY